MLEKKLVIKIASIDTIIAKCSAHVCASTAGASSSSQTGGADPCAGWDTMVAWTRAWACTACVLVFESFKPEHNRHRPFEDENGSKCSVVVVAARKEGEEEEEELSRVCCVSRPPLFTTNKKCLVLCSVAQ